LDGFKRETEDIKVSLVSMYGGGIVLVDNSERGRGYVSAYTTVTSKSLMVVISEYCENSFSTIIN